MNFGVKRFDLNLNEEVFISSQHQFNLLMSSKRVGFVERVDGHVRTSTLSAPNAVVENHTGLPSG